MGFRSTGTNSTSEDELQQKNGQQHQRVYDPDSNRLLGDILEELKKMNFQLSIITSEENP